MCGSWAGHGNTGERHSGQSEAGRVWLIQGEAARPVRLKQTDREQDANEHRARGGGDPPGPAGKREQVFSPERRRNC